MYVTYNAMIAFSNSLPGKTQIYFFFLHLFQYVHLKSQSINTLNNIMKNCSLKYSRTIFLWQEK